MTIDKAIERYNINAEYERSHGNLQGCLEFKQLAEWLKELKAHREAWVELEANLREMARVTDLEYYVHREDNWFDGVRDAINCVREYRQKEGDAE